MKFAIAQTIVVGFICYLVGSYNPAIRIFVCTGFGFYCGYLARKYEKD